MNEGVCACVPPPTQACCFPDRSCEDLLPEVCRDQRGWALGPWTTCLGDPHGSGDLICPYPIPTTSQWGLLVMGLLLMTGAKLRFGRGRRHGGAC
jgi:hypothetical protein